MIGKHNNRHTTEIFANTTEIFANTTEIFANTTEIFANTTEIFANIHICVIIIIKICGFSIRIILGKTPNK